jgi:hypothetical protein
VIDFDAIVNSAVESVFATSLTVTYTPPGGAARAIKGIFDRHHQIVLDEIAGSELNGPGHATTAPVLTVRLAQFVTPPVRRGTVVIGAETFSVWDVQPDGQGCADLVLREIV